MYISAQLRDLGIKGLIEGNQNISIIEMLNL